MERNHQPEQASAPLSRRTLLARIVGVGVGLPLLAACGPSTPSAVPTTKPATGAAGAPA